MTDSRPATPAQLAELERLIDDWLARTCADNAVVLAVDRDRELHRWYVRLRGEEKDFTTVWFTLGQRTLLHETYVMPAPEENHAAFYEHLLRRNRACTGMAFCIGDEDAVFLRGQLPVHAITETELDRILGSTLAYVEQFFGPAMRIGYASRFRV